MRHCASCGDTFSEHQKKLLGVSQVEEKLWLTNCGECAVELVRNIKPTPLSRSTASLNGFPESEIKELMASMSPFNYDTGGGSRVIRSTNTFGG